ncbi:nitrogenase iron-molybdenum cofactor biosynthesis protein NifE [Caldanaerobius polysaccharolyticus]|uniref:nitrogenase iron-molybdenum cofactor biosynthesis protein NifE n=1 Tax=Caldanaerobius polysaccharolyticus TaxID=44256 RepID=UPI00047AF533|nr:nitrogenase iron-molybdenum cofactor biosynthesis protein NifE [Caldanaerobius polysaccharolyticus]
MDALNIEEIPIVERREFITKKGRRKSAIKCDTYSVAGSVSQRACVFTGARVVLNPITDAIHLIHGPIGCASYTWDIRGSLSSGSELYRFSFSTDLKEHDVIFGGEKKLSLAIDELVERYNPKLIFVYCTCIVGVIGDDVEAVCKAASKKYGIKVIPVQSSGFSGNKAMGYRAACDALLRLIEPENKNQVKKERSINYLGDFNLAAEAWIIKSYLKRIGINVNTVFTGDSTCDSLLKSPYASLNIVQCTGSMVYLAQRMKELYGIPFIKVSFLGIEDTSESLRAIARIWGGDAIEKAEALIREETSKIAGTIGFYRERLKGKRAAIYVGGGFKAISLIKQFRELGMNVVMVGTQTGRKEEYEVISEIADEGTIIVDDATPDELEKFILKKGADVLVGGVKERPLAYKLGIAFVDHNHDRKHPLSGYVGAVNFAKEVYSTVCSPVWKHTKL